MKVKNLQYYMQLDYPIELRRIPAYEGGGFNASIPLLGKYAFSGDGETVQEALDSLEEVKAALFAKYLLAKMPIPEPEKEAEKEYSGKFVLRIPTDLHRILSFQADRNSTTLNQYCLYLLSYYSTLDSIHSRADKK